MKIYLPAVLIGVLLLGCVTPHNSHSTHVTQKQATAFLRDEGLIQNDTRVDEVKWHDDLNKWLFIVSYPKEKEKWTTAHWFVDAEGKNYSGGTCQH